MELGLPEIRELIDLLTHSDLSELALEAGDVKISLKKGFTAAAPAYGTPATAVAGPVAPQLAITYADAPVPVAAGVSGAAGAEASGNAAGGVPERQNVDLVRAPMVGTFYRAPSPDAEPFVELGQTVEAGQTVCIIEAMKLMNEIEAEHGGRVAKVCVGNGEPVEFGQVLFEIER